ncbi:MAG: LysR family transcriptional regulator [Proteobacteria bacterium]|nr:LysR family transcriptional regulator [Pseudomonadota bacterium]
MPRTSLELKPRLIVKGERAIGPGKADLLEHIKATGSISAAAKKMDMSYSRAWQLIDTMNHAFKAAVVQAESGGKRGGGARVTEFGESVLASYRSMQTAIDKAAAPHAAALAKFVR